MKSAQFYPGDKVIILNNDEGVKPGTEGVILSKWRDTLYIIRTQDGSFHSVANTEVSPIDPNKREILAGDILKITSNKHNHEYAREGDLFRVLKVIEDMDAYVVLVNGERKFFANFELAPYFPAATP